MLYSANAVALPEASPRSSNASSMEVSSALPDDSTDLALSPHAVVPADNIKNAFKPGHPGFLFVDRCYLLRDPQESRELHKATALLAGLQSVQKSGMRWRDFLEFLLGMQQLINFAQRVAHGLHEAAPASLRKRVNAGLLRISFALLATSERSVRPRHVTGAPASMRVNRGMKRRRRVSSCRRRAPRSSAMRALLVPRWRLCTRSHRQPLWTRLGHH